MAARVVYQKSRRLRLFGGPNGSGKSTLFEQISKKYDLGIYLNPDEIEKELKSSDHLDLSRYGLEQAYVDGFEKFVKTHTISRKARKSGYEIDLQSSGQVIINPDQSSHSYEAALLVDFIRTGLLQIGKKFSFETVMSHPSKLDVLRMAQSHGYKNYLYFLATETPDINVARVKQRVAKGGHPVPEDKIHSRYYESLKQLRAAVQLSYRAFIFDNSERESRLILEVFEGDEITYRYEEVPKWVDEYLLG